MRIARSDIDARIAIPGATLRQHRGFGSVSGYDSLSCEYFSLAAGVDTTPLFVGLDGDACQCPHWGYVLSGTITTTDTSGTTETVSSGDLFHWPEGHNVRVDADAEIVMFSPQQPHDAVLDHMAGALGVATA